MNSFRESGRWKVLGLLHDEEELKEDLRRHWEEEPRKGSKTLLFNDIWIYRAELDEKMVPVGTSDLTGVLLYPPSHYFWHWQFLHVLTKQYKSLEFWPQNIMLGTESEHRNQESIPKFAERKELLRGVYNEVLQEFGGKPP